MGVNEAETSLYNLMNTVSDWLKYAEAKNAGLATVSGAAAAAIMGFLGSASDVPKEWFIGLVVAASCFWLSTVAALISFLPRLSPLERALQKQSKPSNDDNLYFFGDLKKYSPEQLLDALVSKYGLAGVSGSRSALDLAAQVTVNSQIASSKFRWFSVGASFAFLASITLAVVPLVTLYVRR